MLRTLVKFGVLVIIVLTNGLRIESCCAAETLYRIDSANQSAYAFMGVLSDVSHNHLWHAEATANTNWYGYSVMGDADSLVALSVADTIASGEVEGRGKISGMGMMLGVLRPGGEASGGYQLRIGAPGAPANSVVVSGTVVLTGSAVTSGPFTAKSVTTTYGGPGATLTATWSTVNNGWTITGSVTYAGSTTMINDFVSGTTLSESYDFSVNSTVGSVLTVSHTSEAKLEEGIGDVWGKAAWSFSVN